MSNPPLKRTDRSKLKRLPKRGHYDFETVAAILDAGFLCHIGYVIDGAPLVTPTAYWREGRRVYWHGSHASRMLNIAAAGVPVCLTVAHVDGFVMARSAFHHSINYRSVMLFGNAHVIDDAGEKLAALKGFVDRMYPGRWDTLRPVIDLSKVQGGAVHDARIAALCLRHGVKTLLSADRDFSRFRKLRTENPLRGS